MMKKAMKYKLIIFKMKIIYRDIKKKKCYRDEKIDKNILINFIIFDKFFDKKIL